MSEPVFKVSTPAKKQIARAFGLKAHQYDANAVFQKELLSQLCFPVLNKPEQEIWADLGCGTGTLEQLLQQKSYSVRFLCIDIAYQSLQILQSKQISQAIPLTADIEAPPIKAGSLDGIVMASVLQWFSDPVPILKKISDMLKENGTFLFAAFIKGSFLELNLLRQNSGFEIPVHLPDKKGLCDQIRQSGFTISETDAITSTIYYPSAFSVLKSISAIGGTAVSGSRLSRSRLFQFCNEYEKMFRTEKGIPITYQALIGKCTKGRQQ